MAYSQALEDQVRQSRLWASEYGAERAGGALDAFFPRPGQSQGYMAEHLRYAETYFLAPALCPVIRGAGEQLSEASPAPQMIPSRVGWLWFAAPMVVPNLQVSHAFSCIKPEVRAISWATTHQESDGRTFASMRGEPSADAVPFGVSLMSYFVCGVDGRTEFVGIDSWPYDERLGEIAPATEAMAHMTDTEQKEREDFGHIITPFVRRVFLAFCSFLEQRILVASQQRAERHTRRRLERQGFSHEPLIRVVELRRKQARSDQRGDPEPVEWSHQWIVSGHWRNQWCPALNDHQPRWIMPFVKGPPDKPLKPPRAKIFAVVR